MSTWSEESVIALAPDPSAASAARGLTGGSNWVSSGTFGDALWGEVRGSGAKPYQTAVDLKEPAFKCSCPSRKFPCKHGLALLLRHANREVAEGSAPTWVSEWLDKRSQKLQERSPEPKVKKAPNPEGESKVAAKRWAAMMGGLDECENFLVDAVSQGLLSMSATRSWDQMAARMVDAKAPGVAARLRRIGECIGVGNEWPERAAVEIGSLNLLVEAARRIDSLDAGLAADVRTGLGLTTRKDELVDPVTDTWDVLGRRVEEVDQLRACRTWLLGRTSGRFALSLTYAIGNAPFDPNLAAGTGLTADAFFYPSAWPCRAHFAPAQLTKFGVPTGSDWATSLERSALAYAENPWVDYVPVLLDRGRLAVDKETWWAVDGEGAAMPMKGQASWELLALTGNNPANLFGEWDGRQFRLLGAWGEWGYQAL